MAESIPFADFELDRWPEVTVHLRRAPRDDKEIEDFQSRFCGALMVAAYGTDALPRSPLKLTMCLDGIVDATISQQLKAAAFIADVKPLVTAGALRATALVVSSQKAQDILKLILEMAPLTSMYQVFTSVQEGKLWLQSL